MTPPLTIFHDFPRDEIVIEGVRYACAFFRTLAFPQLGALYRFQRDGQVLNVERVQASDDLDEQLTTLSKTRFVAGDVLVCRRPSAERLGQLDAMLQRIVPEAVDKIGVVELRDGEELERLPEDAARRLYAHLHARFGGRT